jgi:hypothetical protein
MHTIPPILAGLAAMAAVSAHTAPSPTPSRDNWLPLSATVSFGLGDQTCGDGRHRALWRDWRGDWRWGPCVANR